MVDYNPASINKLNKRYGGGYESEAYGGSKETFYNKGGFNKIQKSDLDDDTSSGYNQFKRKQTNQGLGSPTNNINNKDDDDDKDVGGVGAFFSRVFSWANESGLEFKKPDRPRPSVLYDRDDMKPIDFDAMDKRIADAVNFDLAKPMPSMNFKDDEYAQSTYDEVQPLEGADTYKARRITAQGINDTIKGLMDTERRQQDIKQAVNKTIESLKSADDNVPYVIQAGDTLSDIAAKTGTTVQDLVKRNNIKDKNKIYTGNELIIPTDKTTKSKEDVVSSLVEGMSGGYPDLGGSFEGEGVEVADNRSIIDSIKDFIGFGGDKDVPQEVSFLNQQGTTRGQRERIAYTEAYNSGLRGTELRAYMAQVAHESSNYGLLRELGYTSVDSAVSVGGSKWKSRLKRDNVLDPSDRDAETTGPIKDNTAKNIFNSVYANRNGNGDFDSGDGYAYRGRGYIQLTGRANYREVGKEIGLDLEGNPDLMSNPEVAAKASVAWWKINVRGKVPKNDYSNTEAVSGLVNRGSASKKAKGLGDRKKAYNSYKLTTIETSLRPKPRPEGIMTSPRPKPRPENL